MFRELSEKFEHLSKRMHHSLVKVSATGQMVGAFVLTLVNYFILDLGEDSFYLPFPILCVTFFEIVFYRGDNTIN